MRSEPSPLAIFSSTLALYEKAQNYETLLRDLGIKRSINRDTELERNRMGGMDGAHQLQDGV